MLLLLLCNWIVHFRYVYVWNWQVKLLTRHIIKNISTWLPIMVSINIILFDQERNFLLKIAHDVECWCISLEVIILCVDYIITLWFFLHNWFQISQYYLRLFDECKIYSYWAYNVLIAPFTYWHKCNVRWCNILMKFQGISTCILKQ